ncbi:MAG: M6 family metalloprotease domain-containing protein [Candidatus Cloacimonadales bacterium]
MKRLLLFVLAMLPILLFSAYVKDVPMEVTQPDGELIKILASGDEFHHWFHNQEGYTITRDDAGYYVYADKQGDEIVPTKYKANEAIPAEKGLVPRINISGEKWKAKRDEFYNNYPRVEERTPTTGQLINLVIFIKFQGESDFATDINFYDNMLNNQSLNANSVRNYYSEVSYGQIDVTGEFFPPVSPQNTIVAYEDSHPRGYYEAYSNSNPIGYTGGDNGEERGLREHTLLANAAEYVESMIPTDLAIDGDNDGYVDNVIYIIKGSTNNWASLLWPHRWSLYYAEAYIHGKRVWDFNFQLETHLNSSGTSVMCHELFHSLGAPDLYRYDSDGDPVGIWDLMSNNTNPPQHMMTYMKHYYAGWIPNITKLEESGTYSIYPIASATNNAFRVRSWNFQEEIYLEYRKIKPLFESAIPSSGLLAYKINGNYAGEGNAGGPPDEVFVYRPGGGPNGGGAIGSAPFNNNNNHFGHNSYPPAMGTNGSFTGLDIYDVVVTQDSVTFKIDISNIILTSLNSGESLVSGGEREITWIRKNSVTDILLEYSVNGGNSWLDIAFTTGNTGSYNWQIPEIDSEEVLIKVTEIATGKYDVINQPLTIISEVAAPVLVAPENTASGIDTNPMIIWQEVMGATEYNLELAEDDSFETTLYTETTPHAHFQIPSLDSFTDYYWRVQAVNSTLTSDYSAIYSFTTGDFTTVPNSPELVAPINNAVFVPFNNVLFEWEHIFSAETYTLQVCKNVYFYADLIETENLETSTFNITNLEPITRYYWRVKAHNQFGSSGWTGINQFVTAQTVPNDNDISQLVTGYNGNYPNPFNPETTISFTVGANSAKSAQQVVGKIYNLKGQLVKELVNEKLTPNKYNYTWRGDDNQGKAVASGVYYLRLNVGDEVRTGKMVMLK